MLSNVLLLAVWLGSAVAQRVLFVDTLQGREYTEATTTLGYQGERSLVYKAMTMI